MKKIIFILMVICFTSVAHAVINELYTIKLDMVQDKSFESDTSANDEYLMWNSSIKKENMHILCHPGDSHLYITTAVSERNAFYKFSNTSECIKVLMTIRSSMTKPTLTVNEITSIKPLTVKYDKLGNFTFEY